MNRNFPFSEWRYPPRAWALLWIAVLLEALTLADVLPPLLTVDFVAVPWALVPCAAALGEGWRAGGRQLAPSRTLPAVVAAILLLLVLSAALYAYSAGAAVVGAVLIVVSMEEAIYRLAIPAVVALLLTRARISQKISLAAGFVVSAVLFVLMPGHLMQVGGAAEIAAFFAFAALMTYAVWRSKSLVLATATHATVDYLTLSADSGNLSAPIRFVGVACALGLLLVAARPASRPFGSTSPVLAGMLSRLRSGGRPLDKTFPA